MSGTKLTDHLCSQQTASFFDFGYKSDLSALRNAAGRSAPLLQLLLPPKPRSTSESEPVNYEDLLVTAIENFNKDSIQLLMSLGANVNAMVLVRDTIVTPALKAFS